MATLPPPPPPIPLVTSSVDHPTVFADAVWFASVMSGVIRIQFIENQIEPSNSPNSGVKARHVGTLAIPREGFKNMVSYLKSMDEYFDSMNADGAA